MDRLIKAVTTNGMLRIFAVTTKDTVNTAQKLHGLYPVASAALGRMLSAGLMMGADLKDSNARITLQMKGNGPLGKVVVVAAPDGWVKGCVDFPAVDLPLRKDGKLNVGRAIGKNGYFGVIKDLRMKEPYIGQVPIQTGEIGDDLVYYFMQSEQIPSVVGLGVLVGTDCSIEQAGGFIIQVMPDCEEEYLTRLEKRAGELESVTELLSRGLDTEGLLRHIMQGFEIEILEQKEVRFACDCSQNRMERVLISLGEQELTDIIKEQHEAEIVCHFCNTKYNFSETALQDLKTRCAVDKKIRESKIK